MPTATYYATLGLASTAAPEVIRAAYKALALIYHPDKILNLAAKERASHAAVFNKVQQAYDVLGNPSLKAAYDAELSRHGNKADSKRSTFHQSPTRTASNSSSTPQRKPAVKLTTPEEKVASRAKARQSLEYLHQKRNERDTEDARMEVSGLRDMVDIWTALAKENQVDPVMHAHCAIRIHEYEQKIADRQEQHRVWLENMSTAKQAPSTPANNRRPSTPAVPRKPMSSSSTGSASTPHSSRPPTTRPTSYDTSPTPASRGTARVEERKRAEAERTATAAARAEVRRLEKAQREADKQVHVEQKAAAVRAEQEKQKARVELRAQNDAERIAKARAKAGAAPHDCVGTLSEQDNHASNPTPSKSILQPSQHDAKSGRSAGMAQPSGKLCGKCSEKHASIGEWRKCSMQTTAVVPCDDEVVVHTV